MFLANCSGGYPAPVDERFQARYPLPPDYPVTPEGIQRSIQLASVLEPLVATPGKTTREADCSPGQRFAFFMTAGVNIGEAFRRLGVRLVQARDEHPGTQPLLYDTCLTAQADSKRQRDGGRTNHGIISMFIPLVASQVLYLGEAPNSRNMDKVFANLGRVMASTTVNDVMPLRQMESLAFEMSGFDDRVADEAMYAGHTVMEYYATKWAGTGRHIYRELMGGQPRTQDIVSEVLYPHKPIDPQRGFQDVFADACLRVHAGLPPEYHTELLADNTAAALYMVLSHFPDREVVF